MMNQTLAFIGGGNMARSLIGGLIAQGLRHVCLVNNHLEPAHDAAVRAVLEGRAGPARDTNHGCRSGQ